jgi:hypothetical protein
VLIELHGGYCAGDIRVKFYIDTVKKLLLSARKERRWVVVPTMRHLSIKWNYPNPEPDTEVYNRCIVYEDWHHHRRISRWEKVGISVIPYCHGLSHHVARSLYHSQVRKIDLAYVLVTYICCFCVQRQRHSDQCLNFESWLPYIRTMKVHFMKVAATHHRDWNEGLPLFLFAYWAYTHETTSITPAIFMFRTEPYVPCDLPFEAP